MNRMNNLHNKTQDVQETELPYNSNNCLIQIEDIRRLFDDHGLEKMPIHNINLYRNAFIHRSYCTMKNDDFTSGNERCPPNCLPLQEMSYERLEFIGDSILGMVCATYLYERYPDQAEGFLSKLRTKLVNGKMLGYLSDKIGFPKYVLISKQVEEVHGRSNYKIMEDVFEAFIGAIYMDYNTSDYNVAFPDIKSIAFFPLSGMGYHIAEKWILSILEKYLDFAELIQTRTNYKDMLVQYMQHTFQDAPRFFEISIEVQQNQKVFTYCVKDKVGLTLGTSKGHSKKEAENLSAKEALLYYGQIIVF
uniref:RNase III domain-containing protein n=1 Tax=viral metagenome TaxID=1070528 RepID=A0A6C0CSR2_9ZZZZ